MRRHTVWERVEAFAGEACARRRKEDHLLASARLSCFSNLFSEYPHFSRDLSSGFIAAPAHPPAMPTAVLDRNMNGLSLHEAPLVTKVAINGFGRIGKNQLAYRM
jgi:hypothetical protein